MLNLFAQYPHVYLMGIVFGSKPRQFLFWKEASGGQCRQGLAWRYSASRPVSITQQSTNFGKYVNLLEFCHLENDSKITSVVLQSVVSRILKKLGSQSTPPPMWSVEKKLSFDMIFILEFAKRFLTFEKNTSWWK